ncbi:hypothetical protein RRG08_029811 [Elysia crispata]|uniref:Uncharacterized protein n=1 Tax=Elysia crispata TaxID=231223 RepID=A0AAE0YLW7_9GAST|nr:hypothetical protein RRG08_029811 [Elysia crispata]
MKTYRKRTTLLYRREKNRTAAPLVLEETWADSIGSTRARCRLCMHDLLNRMVQRMDSTPDEDASTALRHGAALVSSSGVIRE